jgi:hypothetical protein
MILFELMESTHPFDGRNDVQVGMKVQKGEVKPLCSKRPKELVALYNSLRNMVYTYVYKDIDIYILVGSFETAGVIGSFGHPSYLQHSCFP